MNIYKNNLELLKKKDEIVYAEIKRKLECFDENGGVKVEVHKNKEGLLNITIDNKKNKWSVHSNYNATVEAERWVKSVDIKSRIIVILGMGMGYHIQELLKNIGQDTILIIIEPETAIAKKLFQYKTIENIIMDERVRFILNDDEKDVANMIFDIFKNLFMENIEFKIFNNYSIDYFEMLNNVQKELYNIMNNLIVNMATREHFKYLWLANFIGNTSTIGSSSNFKGLLNKFEGKPGIIVSAGPSLDKNIHLLKKLKNKAVIIAGGSAIRILKKKGIEPHFLVAMDGDPLEKDIFDDMDFQNNTLIYTNRLYYKIVKEYSEKKFLILDDHDELSKYFSNKHNLNLVQISPSQTVAGININVATLLGCNPVIFVGQDLAYTNLEKHADGAAHMRNFGEELKKNPKKFIKVKDIFGNDTYTIKQFLTAKREMMKKIAKEIEKGYMFINATEGGIGLDICPNMTLKKVEKEFLQNEFDSIEDTINDVHTNASIKITENQLEEFFNQMINDADELKQITKHRYNLSIEIRDILKNKDFNNSKLNKLSLEVNMLEKKIDESEFYNKIVKGSIEQTLTIHSGIMNKKLNYSDDMFEKNMIKIQCIINQCMETIGVCNFVINMDKIL